MHISAMIGDLRTMGYVLKHSKQKSTVDLENEEGFTAAHLVSELGSMDCLNLLIEYGADL
jgi:ankyrin repeat protein